MNLRQSSPFSFCVVLIALTFGCSEPDQIERYTTEKPHVLLKKNHVVQNAKTDADRAATVPAGKPTDRMLAALLPHQKDVWSFKVTGPISSVGPMADAFGKLVKSVKFIDGKPAWTLPQGWRQLPSSGMRYATLKIDVAGETLDLSVMSIPYPSNDYQSYVLLNVNRWRGQMKLPPLRIDQLPSESTEVDINGSKATFVDLKGISTGGMRGPFASGRPSADPPPKTSRQTTPTQAATSPIEYDVPKGWQKGRPVAFSKASFTVTDKDDKEKTIQITATDLAAAAGDLLPNINRWRGQLKLEPVTKAELDKQLKPFQIDRTEGHYVALFGPENSKPRQALFGIIAIHGSKAWFFKLTGNAELAVREKDRFETFVRSIRFN